jgi:hypothetical protein
MGRAPDDPQRAAIAATEGKLREAEQLAACPGDARGHALHRKDAADRREQGSTHDGKQPVLSHPHIDSEQRGVPVRHERLLDAWSHRCRVARAIFT